MASILSIRTQKCSHIKGAVKVLRPSANGMSMRDICFQHHPPLDKSKQSTTKADFIIQGRKDEKEVYISLLSISFFVRLGENAIPLISSRLKKLNIKKNLPTDLGWIFRRNLKHTYYFFGPNYFAVNSRDFPTSLKLGAGAIEFGKNI